MAVAPRGRLDPAVARVRQVVRTSLADVAPGDRLLVACSGGADSLALASATAFEARRQGWQAGAIVVDHGLHPESASITERVVQQLRSSPVFDGLDPVEAVRVRVGRRGGPENAAREARYAALDDAARRHGAVVLLAHTLDDQAETVLLGLARGSGPRSLAGMPAAAGSYRRPFLEVGRAVTVRACEAQHLTVWDDPQNVDEGFARVRVRRRVLPVLEEALGPGVAQALARTARLLAADVSLLDAEADRLAAGVVTRSGDAVRVDIRAVSEAPAALRGRILRLAALQAGCPAGELFARHVEALDALVVALPVRRSIDLPRGRTAVRERTELVIGPRTPIAEDTGCPPPTLETQAH